MSSPPTVLLSPRPAVRLPSVQLEIPPPPPTPARPTGNLLYQILPVLIAALGMGVILIVGNAQSGGIMIVLLLGTLLLVGGGAGVSVLTHRAQNAAYKRQTRERIELYYRMLTSTRDRARDLLAEQQALLLDKDPDPLICLRLAVDRAARLWERSPHDADFLVLRAGLGAQPSSTPVVPPRQPDPLVPDGLVEAAHDVAAWASSVWGVPMVVSLGSGLSAGVCGERSAVLATARALLVQLATHHAPDEVKLVAVLPPTEAHEWAWLRWLPHTWSDDRRERFVATTPAEAARLSKRLEEILGGRAEAATPFRSASDANGPVVPVYVLLIADEALAESMPVVSRLNDPRANLGASSLFLSSHRTRLPRYCRTILEVPAGTLSDLNGEVQTLHSADEASLPLAEQLAEALAPLRARRIAAAAGLPAEVPLLALLGVRTVEELEVLDRWARATPEESLAVPVGVRPGGETLQLDLHQRADGPHGLLAGSTGSGKSAFMQALLLGLAATFHPHDLAIVLVDYKGGSTAGPLQHLPHLLGVITNLDGNLARRALVAVQAEIERRQAALAAVGCDDLDTYVHRRRRGEALDPLPHLVVVVDEFAELKSERPDFIHQLVRTARVGRNVGVHLVLATQKPRPAVDEEIWANARFRICLRVEQPQDSQDVLKRSDAASLVGRGQGYLQVGHDEVFTRFMGAWGGMAYRPDAGASDPHEIALVSLDGTRRTNAPARSNRLDHGPDLTQGEALARYLRQSAQQAGIAPLPPVWLAPLADRVIFDDLPLSSSSGWDGSGWRASATWMEPTLGVADDPGRRSQSSLRIDLPRAGNLAIYGAPGAGKSTALVTLGLALAREHSPAEVHLYLVDFGGQSLASLRQLPHVGGVVLAEEEEKLTRLLRWLVRELGRRKALFGEQGVATLPAFRAASPTGLPALAVLIDNLPALVHTYPDLEDDLSQIAQQGGTLGIHVVISAPSPTLVRLRLANSFSQAVTLRLADRADYSAVLSLPDGYETPPQSGRGLVKGRPTLECQVALPAAGATEAEQTSSIRRLAHDMDAVWAGARPWQVRTLPQQVTLTDVLPAGLRSDGLPIAPIGLSVDDLEPLHVDLRDGPHFVICGPPRGGKSTLARTWLSALSASLPRSQLRLYLVDLTSTGLESGEELPGVCCVRDAPEVGGILDAIELSADPRVRTVLAIDDLDNVVRSVDNDVVERLNQLVRARFRGVHVLLVGTSSSLGASYDGLGQAMKQTQTGFLIGGSDYEDLQVLGINVPHAEAAQGVPPGRGFYARRKRYVRVQVAHST